MLTAVSLFAGIGGIDLALERAGVRVVAAVEIDPAARGVLADHFPDVALFNDVTEVTGDQLRAAGFVPDRGIVTAGWPCQDFSLAGRRLGLAGTRSGLWWHVVRLLAETRPCWFIGENVPGLLSAVCSCPGTGEHDGCAEPHQVPGGHCGPGRCMEIHGGAMGSVLGSLAQLGYGFAYRVLDAQHFGVPQQRPRVVFVGCLGNRAAPVEVLLEPEGGAGDSAPGGAPWADAARVAALGASDGGADDNDATGGRLIVGTLQAQGAGGRGHRLDAESAAAGHLVATAITARQGKGPDSDATTTLIPAMAYGLRSHPGGVDQGHNTNYVTHALTSEGADASEDGTGRCTPLVPVAFDWQTDGSARARPGCSTEHTSAVATTKRDAVSIGAAVRRLTPTECERLQGFPDGWTETSWGKPQSDSARYREIGNSVAVPVFEWVAHRLVRVDPEVSA
ncbi:MAG TPA: DNA (cytosine-5-)-methyltransferase [Candidatus Limnocylindrales bacterium]